MNKIIFKLISNVKDFYNEINPATLTGAIDVVVVRQEDGSCLSSPFHVRFGKLGVLRSREKVVDIVINGEPVDIQMKLGENGEAFFVEELEEGDEINAMLGTSPIPASKFRKFNENDQRSQDSGVEAEDSSNLATKSQSSLIYTNSSNSISVEDPDLGVIVKMYKKTETPQTVDASVQSNTVEGEPENGCSEENGDGDINSSHNINNNNSTRKNESKSRHKPQSTRDIKTDSETVIKTTNMKCVKRKKRKRNNGRRRSKNSSSQSSDTSTTSEIADLTSLSNLEACTSTVETIFNMEDLENAEDQDLSNIAITSSSSMPLLHDKSNGDSLTQDWNVMPHAMGPYSHPFSDTDISPPSSPKSSRPNTPIKSDTEFEMERHRSEMNNVNQEMDEKWLWQWGQLPTPPKVPMSRKNSQKESSIHNSIAQNNKDPNREQSMLGSMFRFMRSTKKARHNPESEGIYLDELDPEQMDPEMAALYFPNFKSRNSHFYNGFRPVTAKDDDVESGNGPSLPHSPHSVEGAIGGPKLHSDSESEELRHSIFDYRGFNDLAFSRCGCLSDYTEDAFPESLFMQSVVTYDEYCENPSILESPDLVVKMGSRYMNWATAAPQIMSLVLFQRALPQRVIEDIEKENMPKKEIRKRTESKGISWFWRYSNQDTQDKKEKEEKEKEEKEKEKEKEKKLELTQEPKVKAETSQESTTVPTTTEPEPEYYEVMNAQTQTYEEDFSVNLESYNRQGATDSSESEELDDMKADSIAHRERFKKSLRLTKEQILKLNLKEGSNEAEFLVTTAFQGTTTCKCNIFLWNHDDKIVVSDVDGTITKSDVVGHICAFINFDWAQNGVAQLFTKIKNNGYQFLYLSARSIGHAPLTREYLKSIKQDDLTLPHGPILLNPTSLLNALHREVIEKRPENFKIPCLKDIQALFPKNPFYAGYGNRTNDAFSYRAVGIPVSRIFTINPQGELKHELTETYKSSYSNLSTYAHHMFPPVGVHDMIEFSSLHYWRHELPDVSDEIDAILAQEKGK